MLQLIILIVVIGFVLWAVNVYVPMEAGIKKLLSAVVILVLIVYVAYFLLSLSGPAFHSFP